MCAGAETGGFVGDLRARRHRKAKREDSNQKPQGCGQAGDHRNLEYEQGERALRRGWHL
jgi:hypothetical protein